MPDSGNAIRPALAARIWQVLIEECGCRDDPDNARSFIHYLGADAWGGHEFRFQGGLGFGGKFYRTGSGAHEHWYVANYREHATPERQAMIARANARLAARREAIEECARICDEEYFAGDIRDRIRALLAPKPEEPKS